MIVLTPDQDNSGLVPQDLLWCFFRFLCSLEAFNPLKLRVTIRTTRFNIHKFYVLIHSVFVCFVWISEQTAFISLYSISRLVFITERKCLLRGTDWIFKDIYVFCVDLRTNSHYFPIQH